MTASHAAAFLKFSVGPRSGEYHFEAVQYAQGLAEEAEACAETVGCEIIRLFNYAFLFGSEGQIRDIQRQVEGRARPGTCGHFRVCLEDHAGNDNLFVSWLLMVAYRMAKGASSDRLALVTNQSLERRLGAFQEGPASVRTKSTFAPTIRVIDPDTGASRLRCPSAVDFKELAAIAARRAEDELAICFLDADGINEARKGPRPSLYGLHAARVRELAHVSHCSLTTLREIHQHRQWLDGLFDSVVSRIVRAVNAAGFYGRYWGGDEIIAVAPLSLIQSVVEENCTSAPFELSFSCGGSHSRETQGLHEALVLAEQRLSLAKSTRSDRPFSYCI